MILTEAELTQWGRAVGAAVDRPTLILLDGPLGAGKSTLARAIARGAGVTSNIPSPTFNILLSYAGRGGLPVTHADLYRIETPDELDELGWEDLVADGLVMVEWPDRAGERLSADRWEISLGFVEGRSEVRDVNGSRHGSPTPIPPLEARSPALGSQ